jgi:hypothetical protein
MGRVYSAIFDAVAVSVAQDLFEIAPPATTGILIHGLVIGQNTDYGDAQAEGLRILLIRGATTTGSGGATITPNPATPGEAAASSTVKRNNTTAATGGSPLTIHADCFNVQAGYQFWWTPETRLGCAPSSRIVVNLPAAPIDAITMSATLYYEETS